MVEPIFKKTDFSVIQGAPSVYKHRSEESGKILTVNFCSRCGTKLYLEFERFPEMCHATQNDGTPADPVVFDEPHIIV
ncbi:MAG: GFA family protein [Gammaproteobacteria bacterium]